MPSQQYLEDAITICLGLPEFRVIEQWEQPNGLHVLVEKADPLIGWCKTCQRWVLTGPATETRIRTPQDLPIYGKPVFLHVRVRRRRCDDCQGWVKDTFDSLKPYARKTIRLHKALKEESRGGRTVKEVAESLRVGYHATYDAAFRYAGRGRKRALAELMGIDEFSKHKGQNYDTILIDLQSHRTVDVIEDRTKAAVYDYLMGRSEEDRNRVQAVCIDMSEAFFGAVQKALPHADVVIDRFHVMQLSVKALEKVRRKTQRDLPKGQKVPLFRARYSLTKPEDKLTDEQLELRDEIRATYPAIDEAATIVEELRDWYQKTYKYLGSASNALDRIIDNAAGSDIQPLKTLAETLTQWKDAIVAYMRWRITNGPTEGTNNKVKTIKRNAYGHRNRQNLRSRILEQSR